MGSIEILDGGLFTTVQDLGRAGYQRFGVAVSGAMDGFALRAANRLVGNGDTAAGLEITLVGPDLRFAQSCVVAVTGADLGASLDGRPIPMWRTIAVHAGSVLSFSGQRDGMRAYLAIGGGIDVPVVLGSRSTTTRSGLGGFEGRRVRAGDVLPFGDPGNEATQEPGDPGLAGHGAAGHARVARRAMRRGVIPAYGHDHRLRVILGPQADAFSEEGLAVFSTAVYTMTPQSDRIGCRFDGPAIAHRSSADIVSDATALGAVQVSGDGRPIVLMADRGTTGGYTKIATVISADIWRLAQASPGDRVRFEPVDLTQACAWLRAEEALLETLIAGAADRPEGPAEEVYDEDSGSALAADGFGDLADAIDQTGRRRNQ